MSKSTKSCTPKNMNISPSLKGKRGSLLPNAGSKIHAPMRSDVANTISPTKNNGPETPKYRSPAPKASKSLYHGRKELTAITALLKSTHLRVTSRLDKAILNRLKDITKGLEESHSEDTMAPSKKQARKTKISLKIFKICYFTHVATHEAKRNTLSLSCIPQRSELPRIQYFSHSLY